MAPIITQTRKSFRTKNKEPRGRSPVYMWSTGGMGVPRADDVVRLRILETAFPVSLPLNIIKTQLASTEWSIVIDEEYKDDEAHKQAAEAITYFLNGHYNDNEEPWNSLQEQYGGDLLSVGTGVIEKVREDDNCVALYPRDGGLYTKDPDDHGVLPHPDAVDSNDKSIPAYWEWGGAMAYGATSRAEDSQYMFEFEAQSSPYLYKYKGHAPTPFRRNELLWTDYNRRSWDMYGKGRVADSKELAEIALNMSLINRAEFSQTEVPDGLLSLAGLGEDEFAAVRNYWDAEIKGEMHKNAILNTPTGAVEWISFRGSRRELQYLESSQWYTKMVWMMFGLNANEVGDIAEVTRPGGTLQFSIDVWRKTTMPLLAIMEADINRQIIADLEPYKQVKGGLKFEYKITHPDAENLMRMRQKEDLDSGLMTINQALAERGLDPVPWGDMPLKLLNTLIDRHSEWVFEHFAMLDEDNKPIDNKPDPPEATGGGGLINFQAIPTTESKKHFHDPMTLNAEDMEKIMISELKRAWDFINKGDGVMEMEELQAEDFNDDPALFKIGKKMAKEIETLINGELDRFIDGVDEFWPKSIKPKGILPLLPLTEILRRLDLGAPLTGILDDHMKEVIGIKFKEDSAELNERLSALTGGELTFSMPEIREDSIALQLMRRRAELMAGMVENEIRVQIGTALSDAADRDLSIQDVTTALKERAPEISHAKSRMIARTEIMSNQREASQVLADSSFLIGGKEWSPTIDGRERAWHGAMKNVIVGKNEFFTVPGGFKGQPKDYPKDTYIVGGDQPFNCRCRHKLVLAEDMPK